jgi:hypothetical protein
MRHDRRRLAPTAYVGSFDRICHELSTTDPEETAMILAQFPRQDVSTMRRFGDWLQTRIAMTSQIHHFHPFAPFKWNM